MRVRRNCTNIENYNHFIQPLKEAYKNRGYPVKDLDSAIIQVRNTARNQLLQVKEKSDKKDHVWYVLYHTILKISQPEK